MRNASRAAAISVLGTSVQTRISQKARRHDVRGIIHHVHHFLVFTYFFSTMLKNFSAYLQCGMTSMSHYDQRPRVFIILLAREDQGPNVALVGVGRTVLVTETGSHLGYIKICSNKQDVHFFPSTYWLSWKRCDISPHVGDVGFTSFGPV